MTLIIGLVYGYVPFMVLPLFATLDRIHPSILEAGRDLGASPAQTFWRVTFPESRQGILAGFVICALPMFGDYFTQQLLAGTGGTRMIGNAVVDSLATPIFVPQGAALILFLLRAADHPDRLLPAQHPARGRAGGCRMSLIAASTAATPRAGLAREPLGHRAVPLGARDRLRRVDLRARRAGRDLLVQRRAVDHAVAGLLASLVHLGPRFVGAARPRAAARGRADAEALAAHGADRGAARRVVRDRAASLARRLLALDELPDDVLVRHARADLGGGAVPAVQPGVPFDRATARRRRPPG